MTHKTFLKWASGSLRGHVVGALLGISVPFFAVFVWLDIEEGRLTPLKMLYLAAVACVVGAVWAVLFWYTVTSRLIERQRKNER